MDNIDEDEMTDECEERLLEIQYFIARDFRYVPLWGLVVCFQVSARGDQPGVTMRDWQDVKIKS